MSEERLKEIKECIDVDYNFCLNANMTYGKRELELYNEVIRLREIIKHYEEIQTFGDYVKEVNLLVDYNTRNEKSIEYIKYCGCFDDMCNYFYEDLSPNELTDLLNILRGEK